LDNAVEETAASATGGVAAALAGSALLYHAEHARAYDEKGKEKQEQFFVSDRIIGRAALYICTYMYTYKMRTYIQNL